MKNKGRNKILMQAIERNQTLSQAGRGVVSDESATGNGLIVFNRPRGTEVILGVGAFLEANRRRHPLGLPP